MPGKGLVKVSWTAYACSLVAMYTIAMYKECLALRRISMYALLQFMLPVTYFTYFTAPGHSPCSFLAVDIMLPVACTQLRPRDPGHPQQGQASVFMVPQPGWPGVGR